MGVGTWNNFELAPARGIWRGTRPFQQLAFTAKPTPISMTVNESQYYPRGETSSIISGSETRIEWYEGISSRFWKFAGWSLSLRTGSGNYGCSQLLSHVCTLFWRDAPRLFM